MATNDTEIRQDPPKPARRDGGKTEDGEPQPWLDELTPRGIVAELDKYIVGQREAK